MPTVLEPNLHRLWLAKQSAKGSLIATTSMTKSPKLVDGSVVTEFDSGSVAFSDGTQFGDQQTFLNSITGTGTPVMLMDPDIAAYLLWLFHGAETVSVAGTNEVQTLTMAGTPTGGSTVLVYDGRTTATVAFNSAAAAVQTALEALPNIGTGGVVATGGPWPGTPIVLTFSGSFTAKRPHPNITSPASGATGNLLTGGATPQVNVVETTPGVNAKHDFTGTGASGFFLTWCQSVGSATTQKHRYGDGRIGAVTFDVGRNNMVGRVTTGMLFQQPALSYDTDPTPTISPYQGMVWTEGTGGWIIDGTTFLGSTSFQLSLNLDLSFVYGDSAQPHDMQRGNAGITITQTVLFDDVMKSQWNTWVYGVASPTPGTAPLQRVPPIGTSVSNMLKKDSSGGTMASFAHTIPGVQWEIPPSAGPALGSGSQEVTLTGRLARLPGQSAYTISIGNQSAAYTV
jgi:hypothetical protein